MATEHFDFIFPMDMKAVAEDFIKSADETFREVAEGFDLQPMKRKMRIPCAITGDSTQSKVTYTSNPYNRIVVFFAPGGDGSKVDDALKSKFRRAVTEAVASSVRTPFWQSVVNAFSMDTLQPVALLNIPSAFLEGAVDKAVYDFDRATSGAEVLTDTDMLSILMEAKSEGAIPSYRDATGARDIYPYNLSAITYEAWTAYIQARWGMKLFLDYWKMSGGLSYFRFQRGIFKKVYGISLRQGWNDFKSAIPESTYDTFGERINFHDDESTYKLLVSNESLFTSNNSPSGLVYYDDARHGIYSVSPIKSKKSITKWRRKLLSWAAEVEGISCATIEGDSLAAISYMTKKSNAQLSVDKTLILNTKTGKYIGGRVSLKKSAIVAQPFGSSGGAAILAGFNMEGDKATLSIHDLKFNKKGRVTGAKKKARYSYPLPKDSIPVAVVPLGAGRLLAIYYYKHKSVFMTVNLNSMSATHDVLALNASDFKLGNILGERVVTFSYLPASNYNPMEYHRARDAFPVRRVGYYKEGEVFLSEEDFRGGLYDPVLSGEKVYYSYHKTFREELRVGEIGALHFKKSPVIEREGGVKSSQNLFTLESGAAMRAENFYSESEKPFGRVHNYNPLRYMKKIAITPFFPIVEFGTGDWETAVGLGFSAQTSRDMLDLLDFQLAFSWGYVDYDDEDRPIYNTNWVTAFIINSSYLPVDMSLGILFQFSNEGSYKLETAFSTAYNVFCGMKIHKLVLSTRLLWTSTTEYFLYDEMRVKDYTGFPNPIYMYNTLKYCAAIKYNNYHQSGRSAFEERGFSLGATFINIVDPQKEKKVEDYKNQLTMMLEAGVKIPFILPIFKTGDLILSLPTSFEVQFYGEEKSALKYTSETLIFGYECQHAIPGLPLYIERLGLFFGYESNVDNNRLINVATDFKKIETFLQIFHESDYEDHFFIKLTATLSPNIGKFVDKRVTAGVLFTFDVHTGSFGAQAVFETNF